MSFNFTNSKKRRLHETPNSKPNSMKVFRNVGSSQCFPDYDIYFSKEMCFYCFDVLSNYLMRTELTVSSDFGSKPHPLFVTWLKGQHKHLRGCIGTFNKMNLQDGLKEYSLTSAINDSRFKPITKEEFSQLHCSVSILIDFEDNLKYDNWVVGVHGIRIEFLNEKGHTRSATYLPEVAQERRWDHQTAIHSLLRKGGYRAKITDEFCQSIKLTRFKSKKMSASYKDYMMRFDSIRVK